MIYREVLPNGVRILFEEIPNVYSVAIGIWVRTGSRYEPKKLHGISHFLEHLLFKGTTNRTARQIAEEIDAVGGTLNAFTSKEYTCFYAKVLSEHFELAVNILTDMFFNPLMAEGDVSREKNVVLEEIKMYDDSPDETVHDLFAKTVWGSYPLGRNILGTKDTIARLTKKNIMAYFQDQYTAKKTLISVAGKVKHQQVVPLLQQLFQELSPGKEAPEEDVPLPNSAVSLQRKNTEQIHVCLGTPGLSQKDKDIYTLQVLNNILGGGLSSRLFQVVREEKGLAYTIYSYHTAYLDSGLFTIYAGTSPHNLNKVLTTIFNELRRLKKEGISSKEVTRSITQIRGNLLLGLENVTGRMSRLARSEIALGRILTVQEVLDQIVKVGQENILKLISKLFQTDKFSICAIGPIEEELNLGEFLENSGILDGK